ncbi:hypothetical protein NIES23_61240 (plasmid) [Trichormus variabilis NIES-23]|uniref:Uncharacterized protein n=1 Tax=Trichormus variabilis NIES-23 TaxID=1973479 RepID=A0A1Z4KWE2_ANAVA|nr:hypothetical protein NIES23_61240 [Trichormus variabilis NIES-23]
MGKHKKKQKNVPPWLAHENLFIPKTSQQITTDAGWEKISFDDATQFFSTQSIQDWRESFVESLDDISDLISAQGVDIDLEDEVAVDKFLDNYKPQQFNVVVAKAVYDIHSWVRILTISTPEDEEYYFHNHEIEAIRLGIGLRRHLNLDIPVINDCQNAVRYLQGKYPNIGWQPRNCVSVAHRLKIAQATKVYNEQAWDEEWDEVLDEELIFDEEIYLG